MKHAIYVLELSSFQLDLTGSLKLDAAVFLNISPDHLDRHGDMDRYLLAKRRIFLNQLPDQLAVVGVDDAHSEAVCTEMIAAQSGPRVTPVSARSTLGRGVYALGGKLFYNTDGKTTEAGALKRAAALRGRHNHQNAAAALAVCQHLGVAPALAASAMERFEGLAHRLEAIGTRGRTLFVNDSKATNAGAAARALAAYTDVFWIAGGEAKEDGVQPLREALSGVRGAYLIGAAAQRFADELDDLVDVAICGDLKTAVATAFADAEKSDASEPVVLLSPAAASYDQFKSFVDRGEAFRTLVSELSAQNGEAA